MRRLLLYTFCICSLGSLTSNSKIDFHFTDEPIDVVIPCVEKDLPILELCIAGIKKNCKNLRRVIVVSKNHLTDNAEWFDEARYPFSIQDIKDELARNDPHRYSNIGTRAGWYYQQLLKLYADFVIPDISSNILILDSDTIFLRPTKFINKHGGGMYSFGHVYYAPCFVHIRKLIPGSKIHFPGKSAICHHMLFQKPLLSSLFEKVELQHNVPFWKIFCNLVETSQLDYSGASEYEIYFQNAFSSTSKVSLRQLKQAELTNVNLIPDCKRANNCDYVSLHSYQRDK